MTRERRNLGTRSSLGNTKLSNDATARRKSNVRSTTEHRRGSKPIFADRENRLAGQDWYNVERHIKFKRQHAAISTIAILRRPPIDRPTLLEIVEGRLRWREPKPRAQCSDEQVSAKYTGEQLEDGLRSWQRKLYERYTTVHTRDTAEVQTPFDLQKRSIEEEDERLLRRSHFLDLLMQEIPKTTCCSRDADEQGRRPGQLDVQLRFKALHPSIRMSIINEIAEEAKAAQLPFYEHLDSTMAILGMEMDRSFYPFEEQCIPPYEPPVSTWQAELKSRHADAQDMAHQTVTMPFKPKLGRPRKDETRSTARDKSQAGSQDDARHRSRERVAQYAPPLLRGLSPEGGCKELWQEAPPHDPATKGQKFYPADRLLCMTEREIERLAYYQKKLFRNAPELQPTQGDANDAAEFLRAEELPNRWMRMWLIDSD